MHVSLCHNLIDHLQVIVIPIEIDIVQYDKNFEAIKVTGKYP